MFLLLSKQLINFHGDQNKQQGLLFLIYSSLNIYSDSDIGKIQKKQMKIQLTNRSQLQNPKYSEVYQQTILAIKDLRKWNQYITQKIYEKDKINISSSEEINVMNQKLKNIQTLINKLQEKYLDPQTSRKITMLKQQYKLQSQRSKKIQDQINLKTNKKTRKNKDSNDLTNYSVTSQNQIYKQVEQQQQAVYGFDYQIQRRMIDQKSHSLNIVHKNIENVSRIAKETQSMVLQQGQNLDIIGDELQKTHTNVKDSNTKLAQAKQYQGKGKCKCIFFLILGLTLVLGFVVYMIYV